MSKQAKRSKNNGALRSDLILGPALGFVALLLAALCACAERSAPIGTPLPPLPDADRELIEEAFRVIRLGAAETPAEIVVVGEEGEWRVRLAQDGLSTISFAPPRSLSVMAEFSDDGQIVIASLARKSRSPAEYIADIFHEWAHLEQLHAGWEFGSQTLCQLTVQEGEARAREIDLARLAARGKPFHQSLRQPIDYAALVDALILSVERDRLRDDQPMEQIYAEGAAQWLASGLTPSAWRSEAAAYCGNASKE
jgi:hypothetical protein